MNLTSPLAVSQALIAHPSVTPEEAGALDTLETMLKGLSFSTWRVPFEGDNGPKTDNLFARLGTSAPHFCFAGHMDVVAPGELAAWNTNPFEGMVKDGYLYGRGTEDMKGAIACFVAAVARQLQLSPLNKGSISFLITCDEEGVAINGTRKMIQWLRDHNHVPDACLVGEPTNPTFIGEMAKIGRRGSMYGDLTVRGIQGHVAYQDLADNPLTRLVNILHALKSHTLDSGTEFFPPSNLEVTTIDVGNTTGNVIPASANAKFSIRFNALHTGASVSDWLHEICKHYATDYSLKIRISGEAFLTPPGELSSLVSSAIQEATGHTPQLSTTGGTSDARFIKDLCPVIEFGTTNFTAHKVNERVKVEDLEKLTQCYEKIIQRYLNK